MQLQHDLYWEILPWLYMCPRYRYMAAVRLTGCTTDLSDLLRGRYGFDHRVLQEAHDKIAVYYRYAHDNGGQMTLPFDGLSYEDRLERSWREYWSREVTRLTELDNEFVLAVLTAVAHQNTSTGYEAEKSLIDRLNAMYGVSWDLDYCDPSRKCHARA